MPGRRKTRRIYHVNLLKKWHNLPNATSLLVILQDPSEKDEEGDLVSYLLPADDQQVVTVGSLTASQQRDLQQFLQEFPDVAGEELGRTTAVQHKNADGLSRGPPSNILRGEECDEEAALSPERVYQTE